MDYTSPYSPISDTSIGSSSSSQCYTQCSYASDSFISQPIFFAGGKFKDRTIRAELAELQTPLVGRKFGKVDRRPLDPPPVVSLRLFELFTTPQGTIEQELSNYEELETLGLICTVNLSPVPTPAGTLPTSSSIDALTQQIVGGTSVEATLVSLDGQRRLLFAFPDLAVRKEGFFCLRYRVFDIFAKVSWTSDCPIQAEVYGGTFEVFSTRSFPGLTPSTELTKLLQRCGLKLPVRERESRKRGRSDGTVEDEGPLTTTSVLSTQWTP